MRRWTKKLKEIDRLGWLTVAFCVYAIATQISMAVMSIAAGVLAFTVVTNLYLDGRKRFAAAVVFEWSQVLTKVYIFVSLLLCFLIFLSLYAAWVSPIEIAHTIVTVNWSKDLAKLWYFAWPLVLVLGLRKLGTGQRAWVIYFWIGTMGLLGIIAVIQHFTSWPYRQTIPNLGILRFHVTLFLGHHLTVASNLIFPFFAGLDLLRQKNVTRASQFPRAVLLLCVLSGLITLFLTYSRMLWIALPIGILFWILIILPKRWAVAMTLLVVLAGAGASQLWVVQSRFHSDEGYQPRKWLWEANIHFFKQRPYIGIGWKKNHELSGPYLIENKKFFWADTVFAGHAHNNMIDFLAGTGVLGLYSWIGWCLWLVGALVVVIRRTARRDDFQIFACGSLAAWVVFQINGITQVNFIDAKVMHQMMFVVGWTLLWVGQRDEKV